MGLPRCSRIGLVDKDLSHKRASPAEEDVGTAYDSIEPAAHRRPPLLEFSAKLAQIFQDDLRAAQLEELQSDINSQVEAIE